MAEDQRHAQRLVAGDEVEQDLGRHHIEARGRLVEDHHLRFVHDGAGDRALLFHARRQLIGPLAAVFLHLQQGKQLVAAAFQLVGRHAMQAAKVFDVLARRQAAVQARRT